MSVNCNYSNRYLPLVLNEMARLTTNRELDKAAFREFMKNHFIDGESVAETFITGFIPSEPGNIGSRQNINGQGNIFGENPEFGIHTFYKDNSSKRIMENRFKRDMVGLSIVDLNFDKNEWKSVDLKDLNTNIFNYKLKLLNDIEGELNLEKTILSPNDNNVWDLNDSILDRCKKVRDKKGDVSNKIYDNYVILSNFDRLLEQSTPFIKVKKGLADFDVLDRYEYVGPKSKMFTTYTTGKNADFADATEQVSDLSKILLDVIPEVAIVDGQEKVLLNKGIGLAGFNSAMTSLKSAITSGQLLKAAEQTLQKGRNSKSNEAELTRVKNAIRSYYRDGLKANIGVLIDMYNTYIGSKPFDPNTISGKHKTFLLNKLRGIRKFICSDTMPIDLRNMYYAMFRKTERIEYRAYSTSRDGDFGGNDLSASLIDVQSYHIQDMVNGAIAKIRNSNTIANTLKSEYNIQFDDINTGKSTESKGTITLTKDDRSVSMTYTKTNNRFKVSLVGDYDPNLLKSAILDVLSYVVPSDYETVIPGDVSADEHFAHLLAITLLASRRSFDPGSNVTFHISKSGRLDLQDIKDVKNDMAQRLGVIFGSETKNIVKGPSGNNLPLFQLTSLIYNLKSIINDYSTKKGYILDDNLIIKYPDLWEGSVVRSDVMIDGYSKSVDNLKTKELLQLAIFEDFAAEIKNDRIYLQNAVFADKGTHFLQKYNLKTKLFDNKTLRELIDNITDSKTQKELDQNIEVLSEFTRKQRESKIKQVAKNIIEDYEKVYKDLYKPYEKSVGEKIGEDTFKKLLAIDYYLKNVVKTKEQLAIDFGNNNLYEEIHYYVPHKDVRDKLGELRFNETILAQYLAFTNKSVWNQRIKQNHDEFLKTLMKENIKVNRILNPKYAEYLADGKKEFSDLHEKNSGDVKLTNGKTTLPIVEAFFYTDILLSNEFDSVLLGEVYAHPNKNKDLGQEGTEDYYQFSEANRWIAQIKRTVIPGATVHPFAQKVMFSDGYDHGVAETLDAAIFEDIPAQVWNISGQTDKVDSMDGSGLCLQIQSRLENNSLIDARVGDTNKKTIVHDIDYRYGRPTLLKWAVYALTNELRRNGYRSVASAERLVRRMMSRSLDRADLDLAHDYEQYKNQYGEIYFFDVESGQYFRIDSLTKGTDGRYTRNLTVMSKEGVPGESRSDSQTYELNDLYTIDQIFGGAWAGTFTNGHFQYTDANNDIIENVVCKYSLKDKFIGYAVNKSAIKVGAGNVNDVASWSNNDTLKTIKISTKYGGVQMDADHELDLSEVTEMTQMISALIEGGHYSELVWSVYQDIGQILAQKLKGFITDVKEEDRQKELYNRLADSFIRAFTTGQKDTIGLAQAFVKKAQSSLIDGDYKFKLPFSAATLSGAFISDVASTINKKGIRRKFEGFAGVLNPSYNMMQFYRPIIDGKEQSMLFEEFAQYVRERGWSIDYLDKLTFGNVQNPFAVPVTDPTNIKYEDTLCIKKSDGTESYVVINSMYNYDKYVNRFYEIKGEVYKITSAPRNLAQGYTNFSIKGKTFNLMNLDTVRAAYYLQNQKALKKSGEDINALMTFVNDVCLANNINTQYSDEDKVKELNKVTQKITKALDSAKSESVDIELGRRDRLTPRSLFRFGSFIGKVLNIDPDTIGASEDTWMTPHEIITGKYQWEKFGIDENTTLNDILKGGANYFKTLLSNRTKKPNVSEDLYDVVLYTKNGEVLVKFGEIPTNYKIEEDPKYMINERAPKDEDDVLFDGEYICRSDGKKFFIYTDNDGNTHQIITVNSSEAFEDLINADIFDDMYRLNIRQENLGFLEDVAYLEGDRIDLSLDIDKLRENEENRIDSEIDRLAEARWQSFNELNYYTGARIPTQEMASFMPMKVIAVTNCPTNQIYVPRSQTWLQGSDYDIDKLYILIHSVDDNGRIDVGSALQGRLPLNAVRRFVRPNGVKYTAGEGGYVIPQNVANRLTNNTLNRRDQDFLVRVFNDIYNSGKSVITFDNVDEKVQNRLLYLLNKHSLTRPRRVNSLNATKNRIVDSVLDITRAAQNQMMAFNPINMDDQKDAAAHSIMGGIEKRLSTDNAAAKFIMQEQNMVGKQVIGIVAVSLKTYFALSTFYNNLLDRAINQAKSGNVHEMVQTLKSVLVYNPITGQQGVISNLDIDRFIDSIDYDTNVDLDSLPGILTSDTTLREDLNRLSQIANANDCPKILSGLLSAATDNAKELILAKINATPELVDIYTYCAMLGMSFKQIANFMSSKELSDVTTLLVKNIFDPSTMFNDVKKNIDFVLGGAPYFESQPLRNLFILSGFKLPSDSDERKDAIKTYLQDNAVIQKLLDKAGSIRPANDDDQALEQQNDYKTFASLTRKEKLNFMHTLEMCMQRNNILDSGNAEVFEKVAKVVAGVKEMSILGRTLGVNQGLRTNQFGQYSFLYNFEDGVNETQEGANKAFKDFNFLGFLKNPIEKQMWISQIGGYNYKPITFNILGTLASVPNFAKMADMLGVLDDVLTKTSTKYRVAKKLANLVAVKQTKDKLENFKLNEKEFRELERYLNERFISDFLRSKNITITIPKGCIMYDSPSSRVVIQNENGHVLNIKTIWDVATFKRYIEDHVIPTLKREHQNDNAFLQYLTYAEEPEMGRRGVKTYYKLPLPMDSIDSSPNTEAIYTQCLKGFNDLANQSFEGIAIGDLFYLYNMIVNQDSFGRNTLTRLFEDLISSGQTTKLISEYTDFLSERDFNGFDYDQSEYQILVDEAQYRIRKYVPNTKITGQFISGISGSQRDFPLDLPLTWRIDKMDTEEDQPQPKRYYQTVNGSDLISALVDDLNNRLNRINETSNKEYIHLITNDDFDGENFPDLREDNVQGAKDLPAFIYNGEIYINLDHSKDNPGGIFHELAHCSFAYGKFGSENNKDRYYQWMSIIKNNPDVEELYKQYINLYGNIGSDIDEEVCCKLIEMCINTVWKGRDVEFKDSVAESFSKMLNIPKVELKDTTDADNLLFFMTSSLLTGSQYNYDSIKLSAEMRTYKKYLADNNRLEQDCDTPF